MGKFSQKMMGKEVGSASVYAEPHTMRGGKINPQKSVSGAVDPNTLSARDLNRLSPAPRVSAGDPGRDDVKTTGIVVRGGKAQTKGKMARGPMA
jgi:hypothetical protein|tara:strand:- start:1382 stop:1663 length:282 start_codon:yes stop_codon:yes gene_type:complete